MTIRETGVRSGRVDLVVVVSVMVVIGVSCRADTDDSRMVAGRIRLGTVEASGRRIW